MLLLWLKTIGLVSFAWVASLALSTLLAILLNSPGDELFFSRSLIAASLGYIVIALSPSWRAQYNRFAGIYTAVWPLVGSICVSAAYLLTFPRVSDLSETSPGTALLGGILMAVHPFLSLYLTSLLTSKVSWVSGSATHTTASPASTAPEHADRATSSQFEILVKYSDDIREQFERVKSVDPKCSEQFKIRVVASENPKKQASAIADELLRQLEKAQAPFSDPIANKYLAELRRRCGDRGANEFQKAMLAFGNDADAEQVFERLVREFDPPLRLGLLRQAMCALLVFSGMIAGIWFGGVTGILVSEWAGDPVRGPQGGALYAVYFFLFEESQGSTIIVNSAMLLGFIAGGVAGYARYSKHRHKGWLA